VLVDGEAPAVALALPAGTRAMHFDGEVGFAETASGVSARDLDDLKPWLDAWTAAANPASPRVNTCPSATSQADAMKHHRPRRHRRQQVVRRKSAC
jgi:hypothetical protein